MLELDELETARLDFVRHFGDDEVIVKTEVIGQEEMIVIENKIKRAVYTRFGALVKVFNLKSEEE